MAGQLWVVDRDELAALIADAVRSALEAKSSPEVDDDALTGPQLCARLRIGRTTLYRLRNEGLPHYLVADSPRYEAEAVHAWLKTRKTHTRDGS